MLDVAKNFPSTLYRASSWPLTSTFTALPGVTASTVPALTQVFGIARSIGAPQCTVKKAPPPCGEQNRRSILFLALRLHPLHLVDAARPVPVLDVEVALRVPGRAVRADELAVLPLLGRDRVLPLELGVGVLAQVGDELVVLAEDRDAALQVGDDDIVAQDVQGAGHPHPLARFRDELPVQREPLDPAVAAVRHRHQRILAARVEAHPVRRAEFAALALRAVPRPDVVALRAPLVNPALAVADVDVAVGADRDAGGLVFALRLVDARLLGERNRHQHLAVERELDHLAAAQAAEPEDFLVPFLRDLHPVG